MLTVDEFNTKYNLGRANIYVNINQDLIPSEVLYKVQGVTYVDERWFLRRRQFRKQAYNYIQDWMMFYFDDNTDADIGRFFGVSSSYVSDNIWRLDDSSVLKVKIPKAVWNIWRKCRMIERVKYKRYNPDFNVGVELDKIAGVA